MRLTYFFAILPLFFSQCGSDSDYEQQETSEKSESYKGEFQSFDLAFGSEKYGTKNEFFLSAPRRLLVNDNGDILIVDEDRIKIFDENGIGKKILGRPGQGPGEFENTPDIFIGPTGYLIAFSKLRYTTYNLYAPDYTFINKVRVQNNEKRILDFVQSEIPGIRSYNIKQIIPLNETEKIFLIEYRIDNYKSIFSVIYEENDEFVEILSGEVPPAWGSFFLDVLPGRRIVCINTGDDRHDEQTGSFYYIHIVSLDTREDKIITRKFDAHEFTKDDFEQLLQHGKRSNNEKRMEETVEFLKNKKFDRSVSMVKVDGQYAFIELFKNRNVIEIFDLEDAKFIKQVIFPKYITDKTIRNGYFYDIYQEEDEFGVLDFPEIRKYKIHPSVYEK
ncbi:hypothetical protein AMJ80_06800 [bacterium SM23_31]|nr:MAG: hypothetical protein AMJ80_06800 [bacterium SM23_31]